MNINNAFVYINNKATGFFSCACREKKILMATYVSDRSETLITGMNDQDNTPPCTVQELSHPCMDGEDNTEQV